ncbi:hypothetical protein B0H13DRAFT_2315159 [Mycena leptocephala]|nr:hypothetical protein B0H13DRAFT_2315159 [Mycena leptocephala]
MSGARTDFVRSLHRRIVGKYIQDQLDDLDESKEDEAVDPLTLERELPSDLEELGNVAVGAKRAPLSFLALETEMQKDIAFYNFRIRFAEYLLADFLPALGHPLPAGKRVKTH